MTELSKVYLKLADDVRQAQTDAEYYAAQAIIDNLWGVLSNAERNWIIARFRNNWP